MIDPQRHPQIFREWFGVGPAAGRIAAALFAAGGETVLRADLVVASGQTSHGLDMSIKKLRQAMEPGAIINARGKGYRLKRVGRADCERALADALERLAA